MILFYPAVFHKEEDSVWMEFPDLEGCQTYADTVEACIIEANEALGLYVESVLERGLKLPVPTDVKNIELDNNSFVMAIYCDLDNHMKESKSVKKTLTIPKWLNDRAVKANINFSETLKNALIEKVCK